MEEREKIKIGIPRGLLYYKYKDLWKTFFEELGCEIVVSPETTKKILEDGINYSIDESCLSSKVYMGHVNALKDKADYVFVPRIANFGGEEVTCTKFHGLYDIVKNTFDDIKLLDYNLDVKNRETELNSFIKLGLKFTKNPLKAYKAYEKAKMVQSYTRKREEIIQEEQLKEDRLKILIVSHPYNTYDEFIGQPIVKYLKKLDVVPIYADLADDKCTKAASKILSTSLYWTYNMELIGSIEHYKGKVDGIIFLVAFPCGPDSLVTDICQRKINDIPVITIVLDELQGEAGLRTRLESFVDIISMKKQEMEIV